jgi:hypothetical protein
MIRCHNSGGRVSGGIETDEACGPTAVEDGDSVAMEMVHFAAGDSEAPTRDVVGCLELFHAPVKLRQSQSESGGHVVLPVFAAVGAPSVVWRSAGPPLVAQDIWSIWNLGMPCRMRLKPERPVESPRPCVVKCCRTQRRVIVIAVI